MFMTMPLAALAQQPLPNQQEGTSSVKEAQAPNAAHAADKSTSQPAQSVPDNAAPPESPTSSHQSSQTTAQPLGTAAAPYENTLGVAASRPAGAVIAPAKQRRSHSFLIRVGLLVGGAAAIGTVVALSKSSPNRPN
jgi:hypothetical protein